MFHYNKTTSSAVGRSLGSNARSLCKSLSAEGSALGNFSGKGIGCFLLMLLRYLLAFSFRICRRRKKNIWDLAIIYAWYWKCLNISINNKSYLWNNICWWCAQEISHQIQLVNHIFTREQRLPSQNLRKNATNAPHINSRWILHKRINLISSG